MRYVNLKKKHKNKMHYLSKNLAMFSFFGLILTAIVVLPLTDKSQQLKANIEPEINEIADDIIHSMDNNEEM